jgi:hypothetical protein
MKIYHRKKTHDGQTVETARMQIESQEIWGGCPHNYFQSDIPKVKAFPGELPANCEGIEFETDIEPDPGSPPGVVYWSGDRIGVQTDGDMAKLLDIKIVKVVYSEYMI